MRRTITHLLAAAAVALSGFTVIITTATPAQAAEAEPRCSNPGNGDLCIRVWGNGDVEVSYHKIKGPRILGRLTAWTPLLGEREIAREAHIDAGQTHSGRARLIPGKCYIGYLYYRSRPFTPWQTAQVASPC